MNLTQCIRGGSKDGRNGFIISFRYDEDVVENREWREDTKTWWVSVNYEDFLKKQFGNFEALVYLQGSLF